MCQSWWSTLPVVHKLMNAKWTECGAILLSWRQIVSVTSYDEAEYPALLRTLAESLSTSIRISCLVYACDFPIRLSCARSQKDTSKEKSFSRKKNRVISTRRRNPQNVITIKLVRCYVSVPEKRKVCWFKQRVASGSRTMPGTLVPKERDIHEQRLSKFVP